MAAAGMKDRSTGKINAKVVKDATASALQQFVYDNVEIGATVYTDGARAYSGMIGVGREAVEHSVSEFAGRPNVRELNTKDQMRSVASAMVGRQRMFRDLIAEK